MFRASSRPSSGATTTAVAASDLPLERGDSSAVGRGRAGTCMKEQRIKENVNKDIRLPDQPTDISGSGDILFTLSS
jgi:hypothetical protein